MIPLKTTAQIKIMQDGGQRLALVMNSLIQEAEPGITTQKLDKLAEELIKKQGGQPSFKEVAGYHWATCLSVNEGVVHGIPKQIPLKQGDILSIDMGMKYRGWHTDMAFTLRVKAQSSKLKAQNDNLDRFLSVGRKALDGAIGVVKVGNRVGDISQTIQETIEEAGFSPVRELVGHGIGRQLHEEPEVPCWLDMPIKQTPLFKRGMVLAIEVIYNQGRHEVVYGNDDGWTLKTADGSLSAMFEHTVAVTENGPRVLTV